MAHGASVYFNNRAGSVSSARGTAGQASTLGLSQAINMFYLDVGRLPRSNEGLSVLLYRPPGVSNWKGPYISVNSARGAFTDPWGNQYRYIDTTVRGGMPTFMIKSNGPDGLPDTADDLSVSG
jgi:general secretion pathway protein G